MYYKSPMILATEGTSSYPFNRLMTWIEALIARGFIQEEVVVLSGSSTQVPPASKRYESRTESCLTELSWQASLIISDCDAARLQLLDRTAKPYILVPRTSSYNEFMDDRQIELGSLTGILWDPCCLVSRGFSQIPIFTPEDFPPYILGNRRFNLVSLETRNRSGDGCLTGS